MDPNLYHKTKKKINKCPNPLFIFWLTEWMSDAKEKGLKSSFTYQKAINTLKKYPARLQSGKECKFLENFGDKICQMLDKKLTEYVDEYGTTEPIPGVIDLPGYKPNPKKRKTVEDIAADDYDGLRIPDAPTASTSAGGPRKRRNTGPREYMPLPGTGPYALIITMYNNLQSGRKFMSKTDLMMEAQPLSDKAFNIPDPGCRYTAWSSMGTLIKKGYVIKESSPAKYSIKDAGCELAFKLIERDKKINENNTDCNVYGGTSSTSGTNQYDVPSFTTSKPTNRWPALPNDVMLSDDDDSLPQLPSIAPTNDIIEDSKFKFIYIDDEGNEVLAKDKAAVLIDDTIGIGFLTKSKYEDLLLSGKRYELDTSKAGIGDYIYAYLHNDDASDIATKATTKPTTGNKPKVTLISSTSYKGDSNSMEGLSLRERLKMSSAGSNMFPFSTDMELEDQVPMNSNKNTVPKESPRKNNFVQKPKNVIKESRSKFDFISKSASASQNSDIVSKSSIDTNKSAISVSSGDKSQRKFVKYPSMDSVKSLSDMSQDTADVESLDPLYVLGPGHFDVVLVVDTHEHYGQGIPKTVLIPELQKYGILYDVRPLQIGDFTWIAREKGYNSKREVVLDYIVERKRMDDLAGSITDGRFREQKFRMCNCGVQNGIYLVEDYGSVKHFSIPEDTLNQAVANTQIIDNFFIKRTKDTKESVAYLSMMTRYLQSLYADKTLAVYSLAALKRTEHKNNIHSSVQKLVPFQEFNESSVKTKPMTVQEMLAKMLVQIQGMTGEKVAAIVKIYPTPSALYEAYNVCMGEKLKDTLLSDIKYGPMQKKINDVLSKQVYGLLCKQFQ